MSKSFSYVVEKETTKYYRVKQISESDEGEWSDTIMVTIYNHFDEIDFTMVLILPGNFEMGSEDGVYNEKPVHTITLSGFNMSRTEVTQRLYQTVMGKNPSLDGFKSYGFLAEYFQHVTVNTSTSTSDDELLLKVHIVIANLKMWLCGTSLYTDIPWQTTGCSKNRSLSGHRPDGF